MDKAEWLRSLGGELGAPSGSTVARVDASLFRSLPGSPFAFWLSEQHINVFAANTQLHGAKRKAQFGGSTKDDVRFLRLWLEVGVASLADRDWISYAKGGPFARYHSDLILVVNWRADGREVKAYVASYRESRGWGSHWRAELKGSGSYFRPGLTWSRRSQAGFSVRALPAGGIFGDVGPSIFVQRDQTPELLANLAVVNSEMFRSLLGLYVGFGNYQVGMVQRTPVPDLSPDDSGLLSQLALRGWSLTRSLDTVVGVSHAFVVPAVLHVEGGSFDDCVVAWAERVAQVEGELDRVEAEIDEICFELYGISEEDRRAISEGFGTTDDDSGSSDESDDGDGDDSGVELDPVGLAAGLVSWCVGVATGRFDVRLATGERDWPEEPDPFDPLPVCSPAMLTGDDGLPMVELPAGYPLEPSPVLVNDRGHRLDVTARVRDVFDVVFGDDADAWWTEVGEVLDRRGELGSWLSKGFFGHHLKTHSKSRRKAPILWPIGTTSGSYQVWLYAHRVTADSLFRVLNDLVVPKLNTEESRLTRLRQEAGPNPSAKERKTIDTQEKLVSELVELRETIEELAPLWAPDLNDGIVIVLAPFWRLFAHHKPWMRELKKHWGKLANGDYDWAQLAMHLWPERVIPKCAEDRSLAIAHGLEDVFWQPDPDNDDKWIRRDSPTTPIDQLIAHRHNPTTKTARTRMEIV